MKLLCQHPLPQTNHQGTPVEIMSYFYMLQVITPMVIYIMGVVLYLKMASLIYQIYRQVITFITLKISVIKPFQIQIIQMHFQPHFPLQRDTILVLVLSLPDLNATKMRKAM